MVESCAQCIDIGQRCCQHRQTIDSRFQEARRSCTGRSTRYSKRRGVDMHVHTLLDAARVEIAVRFIVIPLCTPEHANIRPATSIDRSCDLRYAPVFVRSNARLHRTELAFVLFIDDILYVYGKYRSHKLCYVYR